MRQARNRAPLVASRQVRIRAFDAITLTSRELFNKDHRDL